MQKRASSSESIVYGIIVMSIGAILIISSQYIGSTGKSSDEISVISKVKLTAGENTILKSADGLAVINIQKGSETNANEISVSRIENPKIDSVARVSGMYKFGPSGAKFSKPVELRIRYDNAKVKECVQSLDFYHFNDDGTKKEVVQAKSVDCKNDIAVFEIKSFSEGYVVIGDCNDPKGTIPQVDSISKSTAGRTDTLEIIGKDLTKTVQFYSGRKKYTYTGQVNQGCKKTTIKVPSDLPAGTYTLNIYKAQYKISNGKLIAITGGSTQVSETPSCENDIEDDAYGKRGARAKDDVAFFTECRDVVWMTRNTNKALACSQDFTYNGVPAATWKSWVENEAKAVLDACKDVCHPGVDCKKQPDSVDKDKLLQALENYWKKCIHRGGISCVCNPNPSDPICGTFVHLIGTGTNNQTQIIPPSPTTPITPITPSSSWSPKLTNIGRFPQLSSDGRYVVYGFGQVWAADLQTGEEKNLGAGVAGNWISDDTLTFVRDYSTPTKSNADRYEVKVGEWIAKKTNDDPTLVAGNEFVAADGHWASYLARNRLVYDGRVLVASGGGGKLSISQNLLAYAKDSDNTAINLWQDGQLTNTYPAKTPIFEINVNMGYIAYGGLGPIHGIAPNGQDIDLTVIPWRSEAHGQVVFVNGQAWVASSAWDDANNRGLILLRPWGEKASIVIEGGAAALSVVYANNEFVIATNNDRGQLKVVKVPANAQRVDLPNPNQPTTNPSPTTVTTTPADAARGWNGGLAYNSKDNKWLVVTQATGYIEGRIMGNDGNPIDDVFRISPDSQDGVGAPLAAYSPDMNKFLVVWYSFPNPSGINDAFGIYVSPDRILSTSFRLNLGTTWLSVGGERTSALKYDSKNKKFVLIFESRDRPKQTAILTTIDLQGNRGPLAEIIDNENGGVNDPNVAINEDGNEYCAVYDLRSSSSPKWSAVKIDAADLSIRQKSLFNSISGNTEIEYNSKTKNYLVVYDGFDTIGVKGKILNSCSDANSGAEFIVKNGLGRASLAFNSKSGTYGVIGQNGEDYGNGYSIISSTGIILKTGNLFTTGSRNGQFAPVIASNTQDGTFAATSSRDYAMTRFVAGIK